MANHTAVKEPMVSLHQAEVLVGAAIGKAVETLESEKKLLQFELLASQFTKNDSELGASIRQMRREQETEYLERAGGDTEKALRLMCADLDR